jgi:hypothetical protein
MAVAASDAKVPTDSFGSSVRGVRHEFEVCAAELEILQARLQALVQKKFAGTYVEFIRLRAGHSSRCLCADLLGSELSPLSVSERLTQMEVALAPMAEQCTALMHKRQVCNLGRPNVDGFEF